MTRAPSHREAQGVAAAVAVAGLGASLLGPGPAALGVGIAGMLGAAGGPGAVLVGLFVLAALSAHGSTSRFFEAASWWPLAGTALVAGGAALGWRVQGIRRLRARTRALEAGSAATLARGEASRVRARLLRRLAELAGDAHWHPDAATLLERIAALLTRDPGVLAVHRRVLREDPVLGRELAAWAAAGPSSGGEGGVRVPFLVAGNAVAELRLEVARGVRGRPCFEGLVETASQVGSLHLEHRRLAGLVARLEARLRDAGEVARRGEASSRAVHDFKNVLGVVVTLAEVLGDSGRGGPDLAGRIRHLGLSAGVIAQRLLAFARPRDEVRTRVDLAAVIRRVSPLVARFAEPGGRVEIDLPAEPVWVDTVPSSAELAIVALVANACEAAPEGEVRVELRRSGGEAVLQVVDDGEGMAPEVLARARDLFFTTRPGHDGLGLALVDRCVRRNGGSLEIASRPGLGTRVTLKVPISPPR